MERLSPCLALAALAGCAAPPATPLDPSASFLAVPRRAPATVSSTTQALSGADVPVDVGDPSSAFYLAVNKKELGQPWFLSAYLKQYFPGAVAYGAARSLGVRVVSFAAQNGRLFVFDVEDRFQDSQTFDPQLLVDAWPIVDDPDFAARPGADDWVLVDPAAGVDRFGVVGDAWADPSAHSPPAQFTVELSYLQDFRTIADGVTFEEVFSGFANVPDYNAPNLLEPNVFRGAGTLGLALRRYAEGDGYQRGALPPKEFYFRSAAAYVPDTGKMTQSPVKWNVHPGMQPIRWRISPHLAEFQNDPRYKAYDFVGAAKRGIESWNAVFGFPVLAAEVAAPDDSFADDDVNYLIFDGDPSLGFAFANWRANPNTGEIRGASVYFGAGWLTYADSAFKDDAAPAPPGHAALQQRPKLYDLQWGSMPSDPACVLWAPPWNDPLSDGTGAGLGDGGAELTKPEKVGLYITHVIAHEVGHTLGLRHNFKGSLLPPSSSVMDYLDDADRIAMAAPGSYDVDAIRWLYGLSQDLPQQPFCTDEDTSSDVDCTRFDATVDPLTQFWGPSYTGVLSDFVEGRSGDQPDNSLNGVLRYVRASRASATRVAAWSIALGELHAPASAEKIANYPGYAAAVDAAAQRLFSRLWLDPPNQRGDFVQDPPLDGTLAALVIPELAANLLNVDGIRSYPTRRVCVDVLAHLQDLAAYEALLDARDQLAAALPGLAGDEAADTTDLLSRIDAATHPYFN